MNVFEAEHPLVSHPSRPGKKTRPILTFVCSSVLLAVFFTPFVFVHLYNLAISDIGAEPTPFPEPVRAFIIGVLFAFAISFIAAVPLVLIFRLLKRSFVSK